MHKLQYKNGLLYTSVILSHGNKSTTIDNVIVDTGAFHTIILSDYLEELDVEMDEFDELVKTSGYGGIQYSSVRKKIDKLSLGNISLESIKVDFGEIDPFERVSGLLGLDYLMAAELIIDLVDLTVHKKQF